MNDPRLLICVFFGTLLLVAPIRAEDERPYFEKQIQPILERRCYECHSHRAKELQGGLTLDSRSGWGKGGDTGTAIVPGKPDESLLIKAVRRSSKDLMMPPDEKLPDAEIELLVEWVRRGAVDPRESPDSERSGGGWEAKLAERRKWWCWQPVKKSVPPTVRDGHWPLNPIDRFLLAKMDADEIVPAQPADRWTLARRASFALTGLPPAVDEVEAFVADSSESAYEQLVDRWLSSPQFGEHWARHWMDLVRYSDTHGSEHDPLIPYSFQYRDYLVRAFNGNIAYDRFVREHLAGDTLPPRWNPTLGINESPIGTAFFRFVEFYPTPLDVKAEEISVLDGQIDAFGKTFQGLTIACARCHDHKFDAISARDFHALYGIFASTRTTMHRLESPQRIHEFDQQLTDLKRPIRQALAVLWKEQLTHWPTAVVAARDRVLEADPKVEPKKDDKVGPTKEAAVAPSFPAGTRSLEAEMHRWRLALKAALDKPAEPLHPIARLAKAHVEQGKKEDSVDAKLWNDLAAVWKNAAERRASPLPERFRLYADFVHDSSDERGGVSPPVAAVIDSNDTPKKKNQGPDGTPFAKASDWFTADNFQQTSMPGEFVVQPIGNNVVTALLPRGRYSHLLSNKHGGTLRSPNFTLDMKLISVLAGGVNGGRVRLVIENFQADGILFSAVMPSMNDPRLQWYTLPIRPNWAGRRAYLEVIPRDEMPYPGKIPDASRLFTDGRSGAGIRSVVFHDQGPVPEVAPLLPIEFWKSEPNWPAVAMQFVGLAQSAINAWVEERCTDDEARFVDALLRTGVLLNEAPADHELARLLATYREIEQRVPVPTRAPGVADEAGFDEQFFPRGNYRRAGATVPRRYLKILETPETSTDRFIGSGRRQLADALLDPRNPLTARVMVNRLWQHVFGVGLVKTVDNFGQLGEPPTHPELLDWLAAEFIESGWSIKQMLRLMLTSQAFQASSVASTEARQRDPSNRLLSHAHVRRLDAEPLRDALLAVSGRLDRRCGGLGVPLPLPSAYKDFENPVAGPLDGHGRRSLYLEARRNYPLPLLTAFDQPKPVLTVGQRHVTNVPAQSLALLNDKFVAVQSGLLADRVSVLPDPEERIRALWLITYSRPPTEAESKRTIDFLKSQTVVLGLPSETWTSNAAVWNELTHALINTKEFLYLR